ncbi:L-aspartate oxidase [Neobacillus massiliamazoniensis]|uniref:L-aspartate oxidase n=1 Tax=Neobacillus massiliamazoniensis TaxID=1499688 RepID=A0A0U1P241_9BACI|nr:L-aspartate oxidase [Neobacillus massiliamazoniensis]CRK84283.1 L-aspartate oxidase [Neobacillus massiliamazoniensis]
MTNNDVVIIGSGVAALQLAVLLNKNLNVRIITKSSLRTANSYLAQGGIAAAVGKHDDPSKHYADTLEAGRFHNDREVAKQIVEEAPELIRKMSRNGDVFDKNQKGEWLLGMEGAHSEKRIVHSGGDATGMNLMESLILQLNDHVQIEEHSFAYELIINAEKNRCIGVKSKKPNGTTHLHYATHIIIATGGCGQLYKFTSNASTVSGDGIAMAYLAGAEIADMEFIQFHPTLLYLQGETKGLISEAVRGEGAILVSEDGTQIMEGIHPYKDLAPRHVVSQTIYEYLKKGNQVFLDITEIKNFGKRFPSITSLCEENGVDIAKGLLPVAPGCHFLMGGIKTDLIGRTSIDGLFAIGEAACTGFHGANRLASNSLLEGLYQGRKLAEWINSNKVEPIASKPFPISHSVGKNKVNLPDIQEIKDLMMERVGIIRNEGTLKNQLNWLEQFKVMEIIEWDSFSVSELTKLFMLIIAQQITESALLRTESRGGHFRSDYPFEDNSYWLRKTIIQKYKREMEKKSEYIETALVT